MRIVLTCHQFLPDFSSGTEVLTYETARELCRRGHAVSVFTGFPSRRTLTDAERFDRYVHDGIPVERFHVDGRPMGDQSIPAEIEYDNHLAKTYFTSYLVRERPDVVHFFHLARLSASVVDAGRERGVPMVLTPTDFWFLCPTHQLRLPDQRICPGPDPWGINCVRHVLGVEGSPRARAIVRRAPGAFIKLSLLLARTGVVLGGRHGAWVHALSERPRFLRERLRRIDRVVVPTRIMRSELVRGGLSPSQTAFVPFGIDLGKVRGTTRPASGETVRLGYIGTLGEHKGVHVLAESVRRLAGRPIVLSIYGKPDEFPGYVAGLRRIVGADPRVTFCGTFPSEEIAAVLSRFDALVVPSLWHENSPLVVLAAQAAGCPVIASNMAGLAEVIDHGRNGLLFEAGCVGDLARTLDAVLQDRRLLTALSANARPPASIEDYVGRLLEIYAELIESKRAR